MNSTHHRVLFALFDMAQTDCHATVLRLASKAELTREEVEHSLTTLDRAGCVDAERVRLTMTGLTMALTLGKPAMRIRSRRTARAA